MKPGSSYSKALQVGESDFDTVTSDKNEPQRKTSTWLEDGSKGSELQSMNITPMQIQIHLSQA